MKTLTIILTCTITILGFSNQVIGQKHELSMEILLNKQMTDKLNLSGSFSEAFDITQDSLILLCHGDRLHLLGWGGIIPVGKKLSSDVSSLDNIKEERSVRITLPSESGVTSIAYTEDGFLMLVLDDELVYLDENGALKTLFKLPSYKMAITAGSKGKMYLYDRRSTGKSGLYMYFKGRRYVKVLESPESIQSVTEVNDRILFATGNSIYEIAQGEELRMVVAAPGRKAIQSVVADPLSNTIYFSDGDAIFALREDSVIPITHQVGGLLKFHEGALFIFNAKENFLARISGLTQFREESVTVNEAPTDKSTTLSDIIGRAAPRYYPEFYDFSRKSPDWPESKYTYALEGVYNLNTLSKTNETGTAWRNNSYNSFFVEVKTRWQSGVDNNGYGLLLRKSAHHLYVFEISADGYARFSKWHNRAWSNLRGWTSVRKLNRRGENKLKIEAQGWEFRCFVNDEEVFSITDASILPVQIGFFTNPRMHVTFDDLSIWDLSKIAQDLVKAGDELSQKGQWQEAEEKYHYAGAIEISRFSTLQSKIAATYESRGLNDIALFYYTSSLSSSSTGDFYSTCKKIIQIAKKLDPPPVLSKLTLAFLDTAYKKIQKRDFEGASASYFAALYNSAWCADAYYGLGKVHEYRALYESERWLLSTVKNYELFVEAASADDHRLAEVKKKLVTLNEMNQGLSQPREIQKVTYGSWPYGRSQFQASLDLQISYRFSSNSVVQEKWEETYGKTYEAPSKFPFKLSADLLVRVLPRISLGGFFGFDQISSGDFRKLGFTTESYGGLVRYALMADVGEKGGYWEGYIDLGYGKTALTANYRDVDDAYKGDANIWLLSFGLDALIGNGFGLGAAVKLSLSDVTEMSDDKTGQIFKTSAGENVVAHFSSLGLSLRVLFGL